ncbi:MULTISPECIES: Rv2578c family radical SAM protein [Amycolatopsis]|uniref:Rv2578c family radical SAM protein n=1 Tax=Amycolatopsis TaxID=1813 RepID=UPI000B8A7475|nr:MULTISPECIES: Rv2578c family radical SAM protein [Amycolatopsis]OXM65018.1 radical SAM protein [Amycolatopsis sp. KNN50.9b]
MRWENQRAGRDAQPALLGLDGLVRTVTSPEFQGVTFHEVHARSVLNKVPGESMVPFSWTVNPYRGCSHACTYCLAGDTPILLADGRTKPLAELRVGDEIQGTEVRGGVRHLVRTTVLAHWTTVKPAHRLTLRGGTTLVASGDHRFLTAKGWRHVTGDDRPHLVPGDTLMGAAGAVAEPDAALDVVAIEPLGRAETLFDITTGTGDFVAAGVVSHNCFARNTHTYLDFDAGRDFDTQVVVKVNAPEVLAAQLRRPSWRREHVAMGTNTDPYQRAEGRYRLMPGIIGALAGSGTPFSILTKGTVLTRDLPLLTSVSREVDVGMAVSIALLDRDLQRSLEPGTPSPRARLDLVRRIADAGLPCHVMVAPVLPGLTDTEEALDPLFAEIAAAGAARATVLALHLRPGAREWFARWLGAHRPDLVERYREIYGRGSYAMPAYRRALSARVAPLLRRHGLNRREEPHRMPSPRDPERPAQGEQLSLL